MSNFNKSKRDPLKVTIINVNDTSHIAIKNDNTCLEKCENKPCTYFCPTRVFYWEDNSIQILYNRCIECGACPFGCPYDNIDWHFPNGGYGVKYTGEKK